MMGFYIVHSFLLLFFFFFFFNDTATTEIYTLSLHDALPIPRRTWCTRRTTCTTTACTGAAWTTTDRKSTRLNSSHMSISYAVFCLKKKKKKNCIILSQKKKYIQIK